MNTEVAENKAFDIEKLEPIDADAAVAVVKEKTPVVLLANQGAEIIFHQVTKWAKPQVFDMEDPKQRQSLGGLIKKVGSVKLRIDAIAKKEIERLEATVRPYKQERARIKKLFEDFQSELKEPLDNWDQKEQQAARELQELRQRINDIRSMGDPIQDGRELTLDELLARRDDLNALEIIAEDFGEFFDEAIQAKVIASKAVNNSILAAEHLAQKQAEEQSSSEPEKQPETGTQPQQATRTSFSGGGFSSPAQKTIRLLTDEVKEQQKIMRRKALAAMVSLNYSIGDAVTLDQKKAICTEIIAACHMGQIPHMTMDYQERQGGEYGSY